MKRSGFSRTRWPDGLAGGWLVEEAKRMGVELEGLWLVRPRQIEPDWGRRKRGMVVVVADGVVVGDIVDGYVGGVVPGVEASN